MGINIKVYAFLSISNFRSIFQNSNIRNIDTDLLKNYIKFFFLSALLFLSISFIIFWYDSFIFIFLLSKQFILCLWL